MAVGPICFNDGVHFFKTLDLFTHESQNGNISIDRLKKADLCMHKFQDMENFKVLNGQWSFIDISFTI